MHKNEIYEYLNKENKDNTAALSADPENNALLCRRDFLELMITRITNNESFTFADKGKIYSVK